jgi:hypothetical protein
MQTRNVSLAVCLSLLVSGQAIAQDPGAPLSAIDWLSQTGVTPAEPIEPPVTDTGIVPTVQVTPLVGEPDQTATGLVPSEATGFPTDLWRDSRVETISAALRDVGVPSLPAMQSVLYSLVLTEALSPIGPEQAFQMARINTLEAHGALEPALALVQSLDQDDPRLFAKQFELSLIAGTESELCERVVGNPQLAPDKASEIFCTARSGDWATATILFGTADALNLLSTDKADALARFLDPDLFEEAEALREPQAPDALLFRLFEALGQRLPTQALPRIFAHADLSDTAGWKSQLEAAERLAATGAIPDNKLLGLYSDRRPAASGGIWDRVIAVQQFETALDTQSVDAVSKTLAPAWRAANAGGFETLFANLFSDALKDLPLSGTAGDLAFRMALLSTDYKQAPFDYPDRALSEELLTGIAVGNLAGLRGNTALERAILDGFTTTQVASQDPLGLAILGAVAHVEAGASGDLARLPRGLAQLRVAGLEDAARRAALQILLTRGRS